MSTLDPGSLLGRYEVIAPLGSGGMGVVYRAHDPQLDRQVAIKLLPPEVSTDENRLARFKREAHATAALNHPNLLAIYDIGTHTDNLYLVSELLEGETLRQRLTRGPIPSSEALAMTRDVASGLAAAHDKGIVHRDLKPENIFVLAEGRAKVLDFGLATLAPAATLEQDGLTTDRTLEQLTGEGVVLGTVGYMAPEQVSGQPSDARSDLFALGVVLYEMLTGQAPFKRDTSFESLHAIVKEDPGELTDLGIVVPEGTARLVRHLMEKEPTSRFQSARDLLYDLDGIENRSSSRPTTIIARPAPNRWPLLLGIAAVAALVLLAWLYWDQRSGKSTATATGPSAADSTVAVAVLPFHERGGPTELSYLALGLPDEIVTELSYAKDLAVRSFTQSSRFTAPTTDLAEVGDSLGANHLIVGQYGLEGAFLQVSVEAIDLRTNEVVWRDNWGAAVEDLLALRDAMRTKVSDGLLVALGQDRQSFESVSSDPGNAEAYDLYLQASTASYEAAVTNREAMVTLERSLELDPGFAPAWLALSKRQQFDATLAEDGDPTGSERSYNSVTRALEIDPNLFEARRIMLSREVERGNHVEAFREAAELIRQRPDSGMARNMMAYVLRYAGALEESVQQCNEGLRLDPSARYHRSCHWSYTHTADWEKAMQSIELFRGEVDTLRKSLRADVLTRTGDRQAALAELVDASEDLAAIDIQRACLQEVQSQELTTWVAERRSQYVAWGDPEALYWYGALMADCGFLEEALYFLERSIDRDYCVPGALETDPLWDSIRSDPRFLDQQQRSQACHEDFMQRRAG